jgi:hypothetical protein
MSVVVQDQNEVMQPQEQPGMLIILKKTAPILIAVLALASCSASQRQKPTFPALEGVRVAFSHRGSSPNLGNLHLGESGAKEYSTQPGNDYWLRLSNNSPFTISFPTQSMYFAKPPEFVPVGPSSKALAVADLSEVAVLFFTPKGRYGFGDMYSESFLPAGRSILFNVPRRYLAGKRSIYIEYSAYSPAAIAGTEAAPKYRVYFGALDLPRS